METIIDNIRILILIVGTVLGTYLYFKRYMRLKALKESGDIRQREKNFLHQATIFTTKVETINEIYESINHGMLSECKIHSCWGESENRYRFYVGSNISRSLWEFKFFSLPKKDNLYRYELSFVHTSTTNNKAELLDEINLLLTQVEKAVLKLDPDAGVERREQEYTTTKEN